MTVKLYIVPPSFGEETSGPYQLVTEDGFGILTCRSSAGWFTALGDLLTKHPDRLERFGAYLGRGFEVEMMTEAMNETLVMKSMRDFDTKEKKVEYMTNVLHLTREEIETHLAHRDSL